MARFFRMYGLEGILHHSHRNSVLERLCAMWAMNFAHSDSGGSGGSGGGGGGYDKYSWEGVFASIDAGTYATDYAIGDCVPLDLGSEGLINMQIAAFDADGLADGSGKAPITWIAKELLVTKKRWNPERVVNDDGSYQEGTGAIGGWEKCELRSYLKNTVKPMIPENVRNAIKEVTKSQGAYDTAGTWFNQITTEDVWIPSNADLSGTTAIYYGLVKNTKTNLIKSVANTTSAGLWKLRCCSNTFDSRVILSTGDMSNNRVQNIAHICLCFCT